MTKRTMKPVVGIIGNAHLVDNRWTAQMVGERNLRAVAEVAGALPLMFAGMPGVTDIDALLDTCRRHPAHRRARQCPPDPLRRRSASALRAL